MIKAISLIVCTFIDPCHNVTYMAVDHNCDCNKLLQKYSSKNLLKNMLHLNSIGKRDIPGSGTHDSAEPTEACWVQQEVLSGAKITKEVQSFHLKHQVPIEYSKMYVLSIIN